MTVDGTVGIDLNGLLDVAARDNTTKGIIGGDIPSVMLASVSDRGALQLIAGREATSSILGRGWSWPLEARRGSGAKYSRIPFIQIIRSLEQQTFFEVEHHQVDPADMMAASVEALARRQSSREDLQIVIAIPDDGRFTEDSQQRLINAIRPTGLRVHLLWRSVATVLGLAHDLNPVARRLKGKSIGVLSLLEDGVSVSRLEIETSSVGEQEYVVPKRRQRGKFFPYQRRILDIAMTEAEKAGQELRVDPWQILWGEGVPIRWLLQLPERDVVLQTDDGWTRLSGQVPTDLEQVVLEEETVRGIDQELADIEYLIFEGPALEAQAHDTRLVYHLSSMLKRGEYFEKFGSSRTMLSYVQTNQHNAAIGCVEFGRRLEVGEKTYLDHLPQMEMAVRRGNEPVFVHLIPESAECLGGKPYERQVELDFSIPAGTSSLNFYLLREGEEAPRYASEPLRSIPSNAVPIRVRINQMPAQGRARIRVEARESSARFPAFDIDWKKMEVLEEETREGIRVRMMSEGAYVPPVQPHPAHSFMWVYETNAQASIRDLVTKLATQLDAGEFSLDLIEETRKTLSKYQPPNLITRGWGENRHPEQRRCRAVSSDGDLPDLEDGLSQDVLDKFDDILDAMGRRITEPALPPKLRNQIVTFGAWAFLRCPQAIKDHLREQAENLHVVTVQNDFYAMGRTFSSEAEIKAYFRLAIQHANDNGGVFKIYHASSLFYLLSLREEAPKLMTSDQASEITMLTATRLENLIHENNYSAAMTTCLRAVAGLVRFRLVDPGFLLESEELGARLHNLVLRIIDQTQNRVDCRNAHRVAKDVLTVLENRGAPDTLLQWD
jgi:hypothetical protein